MMLSIRVFRGLPWLPLCCALVWPLTANAASGHGEASSADAATESKSLPLDELRMFAEAYESIKQSYVEPVSDKELLQNAIRGMLSGLDPHSAYLDQSDYENLQVDTNGEFGGLGIVVGIEKGMIKVISPIDNTPADRAGIKAGDYIVRIDGTPLQGVTLDDAIDHMRGKIGTDIDLTLMREGEDKPINITLTREAIKVASVKSRMLDDGYGYLRITQFQVNTGKDLRAQIKKLQKQGPLEGIVLDLRNNPGGVLQAAVQVADTFIDDGLIVYTKGRLPNSKMAFTANHKTLLPKVPMVVLINGGSASASEIVAGALQDHDRAVLVGTDSFGKGSVQTVLPLADGQAIKLTTARYYTPNGRSIQAHGIHPDVIAEEATLTNVRMDKSIKERNLSGHLTNGQKDHGNGEDPLLGEKDFQLYQGLSLLKALNIVSTKK